MDGWPRRRPVSSWHRERAVAYAAQPVPRQLPAARHGSPGPWPTGPFGRSSGGRIGVMCSCCTFQFTGPMMPQTKQQERRVDAAWRWRNQGSKPMTDEAHAKLRESLRGEVILREDARYDEARKIYNGMIEKRPLLIARCADVADVITAVKYARDNDLLIAVRGGGHNGAGLGICDNGLVIDLSMMKGVHVDPKTRTVRVAPGCTSGDVDHATHPFALAVPFGIVSTTGVAGLTLGGGTGYLTRRYGLTIDNLVEADLVLADGSVVRAGKAENADLLWALRRGGGDCRVLHSFLF